MGKVSVSPWIVAGVLLAGLPGAAAGPAVAPVPVQAALAPYVRPTDPAVLRKLAWWQDQKFGLFMHWGPYSQWGVVESWSICPEDESWCARTGPLAGDYFGYRKAYEGLGRTFNPTAFDPASWAAAAKAAGMRYVVFTTKHHDGFCMFDTKTTSYKVTDPSVPFLDKARADITRGVFDAFRREGLGIGAYFSKPDWHSQDYWWGAFPPRDRHANYDTAKYPERWKAFVTTTHRQVEELMTGYGNIDILWLDGGWVAPPREDIDMPGLAAMARGHQPGLIVVDREVHGAYEDYRTPEQKVPDAPLDYPWETCMTMGNSWSYVPGDTYKDARTLIQTLCRVVSRGGNFLLNIGPGPTGEFDPVAMGRLKEIGAWMAINGEAIHGTRPVAPYQAGPVVFTGRGNRVYAHVLAEGAGSVLPDRVRIPGACAAGVTRVELLGHKGALRVDKVGDGSLEIRVPAYLQAHPPCAHVWVFKLVRPS